MKKQARRGIVAIVGSIVVVLGIIMIPYPGPGWLVVFAGLGILSTEFTWAARTLAYARGKYDAWTRWVANQSIVLRTAIWLLTAIVVVLTIWLINGYGSINEIFGLNQDWVNSPLFR